MRVRTLLLATAFVLLTGQRCQPRDRFCTDISMTLTLGQPGVLIPNCVNSGPLQFQDREVVSFPGLTPELTTAEVPQGGGFYAVMFTPTNAATPGTVTVTLHDVPDPNFPRVSDDYTIHVRLIAGQSPPPTLTQAFSESSVPTNTPVTLTFTLFNPNTAQPLTGVSFQDKLPSGLVTVPNSESGTCGQNLVLLAQNPDVIVVSGVALDEASSCTLSVQVESSSAGSYTNTTGAISSNESGPGQPASPETLVVSAVPLLTESFVPQTVPVNVPSSLQFTITNQNGFALSGVEFQDALPSGLLVNPTPQNTQACGGTVTASGSSIALAGGALDSGAQCTFSISVSSAAPGTYTNDTGPIGASETGSGSGASATLTVVPQSTRLLSEITLAPASGTIVVGHALLLSATGLYSDGTSAPLTGLTWSSSSPGATVNPAGIVLGASAADGILITARDPVTGVTGSATINVRTQGLYAITVTPNPYQLGVGGSIQLTATGYGTAGPQQMSGLNWGSSAPSIVSVNNQGVATAVGAADSGPVQITATDPVTGISGTTTLGVFQDTVNVSVLPQSTGGSSNLACLTTGAGPFNYAWRAYQDDGTTGGAVFSPPDVEAPTVTLSTVDGNGANFYVFCDISFKSTGLPAGSGYAQVTLSSGDTIPTVTVSPPSIHAGVTDVIFDGSTSVNVSAVSRWVVQYGGNVVPSGLEDYLKIAPASWVTVFSDSGPTPPPGLVENVPAANFSAPGAYRVQVTVQSSNDFTFGEGTFYFQVAP